MPDTRLQDDATRWLLEVDERQPGVRYFALRDLLGLPDDSDEVRVARYQLMTRGPVPAILDAMYPEGYWASPGAGYSPKYRGTIWQVVFLAQLGADGADPRVQAACNYILDHARSPQGGFSYSGGASGHIQCHAGNLGAALLDLGWPAHLTGERATDPRLVAALDWLARSVTGDGFAPADDRDAPQRYYRSGNSGPGFLCSANNHQPCAWGAVKVLLALAKVPAAARTPVIDSAIQASIAFLLSRDPAVADYPTPTGEKPSGSWFKFGFPVGYVTDVLQNLEALTSAGVTRDRRLEPALEFVAGKADAQGRWRLEYTYEGKTWFEVERKGEPSKWVTLRALRTLMRARGSS